MLAIPFLFQTWQHAHYTLAGPSFSCCFFLYLEVKWMSGNKWGSSQQLHISPTVSTPMWRVALSSKHQRFSHGARERGREGEKKSFALTSAHKLAVTSKALQVSHRQLVSHISHLHITFSYTFCSISLSCCAAVTGIKLLTFFFLFCYDLLSHH